MEQSGIGLIAVVDERRPVGVVTDRDLVRRPLRSATKVSWSCGLIADTGGVIGFVCTGHGAVVRIARRLIGLGEHGLALTEKS